jgi:hypothetical protein
VRRVQHSQITKPLVPLSEEGMMRWDFFHVGGFHVFMRVFAGLRRNLEGHLLTQNKTASNSEHQYI